jgi:hypothetical protein
MDECHCICHSSDNVKHCIPCCYSCDICGARIKFSLYNHMKKCHPDEEIKKEQSKED